MGVEIFYLLLGKHIICDYFLQRAAGYRNKHVYLHMDGVEHAAMHAAGTLLVLLIFAPVGVAVLLALLDGITHYHVDYFKRRLLGTNAKPLTRAIAILIDQAIHLLTYVLIIGVL